MYGLPASTNLDFLKGKTLIQVCFGANDLIFNVSDNISIAVFSSVGVGADSESMRSHVAFQEVASELISLVNRDIVDIAWTTDGTITLTFDNGSRIQIYDDSATYESYVITSSLGQVVV